MGNWIRWLFSRLKQVGNIKMWKIWKSQYDLYSKSCMGIHLLTQLIGAIVICTFFCCWLRGYFHDSGGSYVSILKQSAIIQAATKPLLKTRVSWSRITSTEDLASHSPYNLPCSCSLYLKTFHFFICHGIPNKNSISLWRSLPQILTPCLDLALALKTIKDSESAIKHPIM